MGGNHETLLSMYKQCVLRVAFTTRRKIYFIIQSFGINSRVPHKLAGKGKKDELRDLENHPRFTLVSLRLRNLR